MTTQAHSTVHLPRVEIKFCVKCKWNLRASYYAQELLQTFCSPPSDINLGEIALVPVSGGIFTVTLQHATSTQNSTATAPPATSDHANPKATSSTSKPKETVTTTQIWDRKSDGGFPETKELKNRIRNLIDPDRDMGHIDRSLKRSRPEETHDADGDKMHMAKEGSGKEEVAPAPRDEQLTTVGGASTLELMTKHAHPHTREGKSSPNAQADHGGGEIDYLQGCEECKQAAHES